MSQGNGAIICIPTFNERENIERIVTAVLTAVPEAHVLVIDDNSPDGTGRLADAMAVDERRIHVLHRPQKQGLGRAYVAGFCYAVEHGFQRVVELDADFSHDPRYLPEMLSRLETNADVVVGSRRVPGSGVLNWSMQRRLVSAGGSLYAKTVLGVPIRDLTGGFNGFRVSALRAIKFETIVASGYMFQIEIKYRCAKAVLAVEEMPIIFADRTRGQSKMTRHIFTEALVGVWRLRLGVH